MRAPSSRRRARRTPQPAPRQRCFVGEVWRQQTTNAHTHCRTRPTPPAGCIRAWCVPRRERWWPIRAAKRRSLARPPT
jgi:hypothetical protein